MTVTDVARAMGAEGIAVTDVIKVKGIEQKITFFTPSQPERLYKVEDNRGRRQLTDFLSVKRRLCRLYRRWACSNVALYSKSLANVSCRNDFLRGHCLLHKHWSCVKGNVGELNKKGNIAHIVCDFIYISESPVCALTFRSSYP